jgi:replicative DNA helicase
MFDEELQPLASAIWEKQREGLYYDTAALESAAPGSLQPIIDCATKKDLIAEHAVAVRNTYFAQQDAKFQSEMQAELFEGTDYHTARSNYNAKVEALLFGMAVQSTKGDKIREAQENVLRAMQNDGLSGIPLPYPAMNEFTGGWQLGDYNLIGARPMMGKTTFKSEIALHAAMNQVPTVFFSMGDMTATALYTKWACLLAGLPMKAAITGDFTSGQYKVFQEQLERVYDWPIEIHDLTSCDARIGAIQDKVLFGIEKHGWQMVLVDYVQQLEPNDNRLTGDKAYQQISKGLQSVAKKHGTCVIASSQLNRAVEARGGTKRPQMSDLRSSGNFEQDADGIFMLYRPGYYNIDEDEEGNDISKRTEVICSKYRVAGDEVPSTFFLEWQNQRLVEEQPDYGEPAYQQPTAASNGVLIGKTAGDGDVPF